jgi:hypothetical protein
MSKPPAISIFMALYITDKSVENRLLYPYKQVLASVTLCAEKRTIIEERYIRMLQASFWKCRRISMLYNTSRIIITIGSIIVPALISIQYISEAPFLFTQSVYWATWVLSLLVTISNGFMTMFKFDRKYYLYHASFEQMKTEGWQYLALTGNYKGPKVTHETEFNHFTQTIERIRMRQTEEEYIRLQDVNGSKGSTLSQGGNGAIPVVFDYQKTPSKDDIMVQVLKLLSSMRDKNSVVEVGDGGRTSETVYTQSTKAPETEAQEGLHVP